MNTDRIKEIQQETAYSESVSVQQALLKVWNECEQDKAVNKNDLLPDVISSFSTDALQGELESRGFVVIKDGEHFE
tara:strand:+ start:1334 stop:1561 length:228 start_codon:yes stop_codon:yes gene_type:complete